MKLRLKFICVSVLLFLAATAHADAFDDAALAQDKTFANEQQNMDADWQKYTAEQEAAYKAYLNEIEQAWGNNGKVPTRQQWVDYDADRQARTEVDYEHGKVEVSVLVDANSMASNPKQVQLKAAQRLQQKLAKTITTPAKLDAKLDVPLPSNTTQNRPKPKLALQSQLAFSDGKEVTPNNAKTFAAQVIAHKTVQQQRISTPEGDKVMLTIRLDMVPNHLQRRAKPYLPRVKAMAKRFDIPAALILGIIHTESNFNPMARSGVPAFGMMQLVPRSGGRDAYQYVFKKDRILPADYLYDADQNIELGSAYLKLLHIREMKRISNPEVRTLCAIAAYNTGGGNVAKAFIAGSRNIRKASKIINQMDTEEVYQHLRQHLPYEETRHYIERVRKRMLQWQ
ncbi:MAG: murein transglycosylase domain-containing protein [Mariprofundales bacterium]